MRNISQKGFSLIEMLVVIVLFAFMAYFVTQSTLQSFKGAQKADAQSKVRDNLDFAASVVERNLRNAKSITTPAAIPCNQTVSRIDYIDQNDAPGSFICNLAAGNLSNATSTLTSTDIVVTTCSFTCTQSSALKPPVIDLQLIGRENTTDTSQQSQIAVSRHIVLRVY